MKPQGTDHALLRWESLYRSYYQPLMRVAFRFMHDVYLSEDAVQQTFMRLFMYRSGIERIPRGCEWGYLKAVLSHACIEQIRQREPLLSQSELSRMTGLYPCCMSAENEVLTAICLKEEMGRLPDDYIRPLVMHYLGAYSYEEIAGILGLTPAAVRKRSQRGRSMLAKRIKRV